LFIAFFNAHLPACRGCLKNAVIQANPQYYFLNTAPRAFGEAKNLVLIE